MNNITVEQIDSLAEFLPKLRKVVASGMECRIERYSRRRGWCTICRSASIVPGGQYRITYVPAEYWLNIYPDGVIVHTSKSIAIKAACPNDLRVAVHVREVIEPDGIEVTGN